MIVLAASVADAMPLIGEMANRKYSGFGHSRFVLGEIFGEPSCIGLLDRSQTDLDPALSYVKSTNGSSTAFLLGTCSPSEPMVRTGDLVLGDSVRNKEGASEIRFDPCLSLVMRQHASEVLNQVAWTPSFSPKLVSACLIEQEGSSGEKLAVSGSQTLGPLAQSMVWSIIMACTELGISTIPLSVAGVSESTLNAAGRLRVGRILATATLISMIHAKKGGEGVGRNQCGQGDG